MAVTTQGSRERVRRAAVKLFAAKGFHGTGIRDLAQEAKLSSASLYHYMGTKEELLAEIMRESLERLTRAAGTVIEGVDDPRQRLADLAALHVLTHAVRPNETQVVDNEVRSLTPASKRAVVALRDGYEKLWADTLAEGIAAGCFHTTEPAITRLALLEMCGGPARWYSPRGALSLDQLANHYARLALRAVACTGDRWPEPDLARARATVSTVWGRRL